MNVSSIMIDANTGTDDGRSRDGAPAVDNSCIRNHDLDPCPTQGLDSKSALMLKKHFRKMESVDSGASFESSGLSFDSTGASFEGTDISECPECQDAHRSLAVRLSTESSGGQNQDATTTSVRIGDFKVRLPDLSMLGRASISDSGGSFDSNLSDDSNSDDEDDDVNADLNSAKPVDRSSSKEVDYSEGDEVSCHSQNNTEEKYDSDKSQSTTVSDIFSKVAKSLINKSKTKLQNGSLEPHVHDRDEAEERCCKYYSSNHHCSKTYVCKKLFASRARSISDADVARSGFQTEANGGENSVDIKGTNLSQPRHFTSLRVIDSSLKKDFVQYQSADGNLHRPVWRSESDSGGSTGSHDLSDSEKTELNCTKSQVDMAKSDLSLDMGISLASLDSLDDKTTSEHVDNFVCKSLTYPEKRQEQKTNTNDPNICRTLSMNNSELEESTMDEDTPIDMETVSLKSDLASSRDEYFSCASNLSSSESNISIYPRDFSFFARELLQRGGASTEESSLTSSNSDLESCKSDSFLVEPKIKRAPLLKHFKKKRDFHSWEHDILREFEESSDICKTGFVQYLNGATNNNNMELDDSISERVSFNLDGSNDDHEMNQPEAYVVPVSGTAHLNRKSALGQSPDCDCRCFVQDMTHSREQGRYRRVGVCGVAERGSNATIPVMSDVKSSPSLTSSTKDIRLDVSGSSGINATDQTTGVVTVNVDDSSSIVSVSDSHSIASSQGSLDVTSISSGNNLVAPTSSNSFSPSASGAATPTTKSKRPSHISCLRTVGSAFRRISNPAKGLQLSNIFGSHKCTYDLELASLAYFRSCPSSPAKTRRRKKSLQLLSTSTLTKFKTASLPSTPSAPCVPLLSSSSATLPALSQSESEELRDSPSFASLPATPATVALLSQRGRSFSVDACNDRTNSGPVDCRRQLNLDGDKVRLRKISFENASHIRVGDSLLLLDTLFDAKKVEKNKVPYPYDGTAGKEPKKAQQFGLSLQIIKEHTGRIIPMPVEDTVEFLKASGGDEVEGLFRRCARVSTMREVQEKYDDGEKVDFHVYCDPHLAAAILKKFLRELQEPLMTFDLFEPITRLHFLEPGKQLAEVQRILKDELPEDNYVILKYVFQFLQQVVSKSDINHMTAENIATVFGPNIAWPKGQANLASVEQAVKFALILVQSFDDVFLR